MIVKTDLWGLWGNGYLHLCRPLWADELAHNVGMIPKQLIIYGPRRRKECMSTASGSLSHLQGKDLAEDLGMKRLEIGYQFHRAVYEL